MDNGPGKETRTDLPNSASYCVDCGAIFIYDRHRDCPACHVDERLDELESRIEDME